MLKFLCVLTILTYSTTNHPFYVSLTDIRIQTKHENIEWSQRVFLDDIEAALTKRHKKPISLANDADFKTAEQLLKQYFLENTGISLNGRYQPLNWLGYEVEEDVVWVYMETKFSGKAREISVRNRILMDDFDTQQNIINVYIGKKPISQIFTKDKDHSTWTF